MTKILLIAPTCDGQDVGEAWVTFQWVRRLVERHDTTVLTYHKRGSTPLRDQLSNARVIEWVEPPIVGRFERFNSMLKPGYLPFYAKARSWIRRSFVAGERFDLGHQLSPVSLRYPTPLVGSGIPYILGPQGGSLQVPAAFESETSEMPWFVDLRRLDRVRIKRDPVLRRSFREAACVIGIASYVRDTLEDVSLRRFEVMPDTGIEVLPEIIDRRGRSGPVKLLFVGRLVPTKGLRHAIRALSLLSGHHVVLDVVGHGQDRDECEKLAEHLGVSSRITFHGFVEHDRVAAFYAAADIFVFPSYREPGGIVVAEAMAYGLPVIVCNAGGPASSVDTKSGIRVSAVSPVQYAEDLSEAIRALVIDPIRRLALGEGARRRIQEVGLWDKKVEMLNWLYKDVLANTQGP